MLKLKKIKSDASWGKVVDDINGNNGAIVTAVEMSKFANVDWGDEVAFPIVNAISSSATLQHNTCYLFGEVEELNITLDSDASDFVKVYMFQFHSGATPTMLSVPSKVRWANDPIISANRVYQVTIIDGYATYREFLSNTAEIPTTEIWYTSLDGNVVEPYSKTVFGADYVLSTYGKSKGIITFGSEVTMIGDDAFRDKTTLTSVTPPNSVTSIGKNAFRGCTALQNVYISNVITEIGNNAFYGCTGLTNVHIPDSVTSIGSYAFYECTSLTSITISDSVTTLGSYVFYESAKIERAIIGNGVTAIKDGTFYDCYALKSVTIGKNVTSIGISAFRRTSLEDVVIPEGLTTIGHHAFQLCRSLKTINIPSTLTSVDAHAFESTIIEELIIPKSLISIGDYAFYAYYTLVKVTFESDTPPTLGASAFMNTSSLKIYVPNSAVETYKAAYTDYADKIVGY